jgi:hypothetical protein
MTKVAGLPAPMIGAPNTNSWHPAKGAQRPPRIDHRQNARAAVPATSLPGCVSLFHMFRVFRFLPADRGS